MIENVDPLEFAWFVVAVAANGASWYGLVQARKDRAIVRARHISGPVRIIAERHVIASQIHLAETVVIVVATLLTIRLPWPDDPIRVVMRLLWISLATLQTVRAVMDIVTRRQLIARRENNR